MLERARGLGLPVRLVGRRLEALEALAGENDEVAVADARDEDALRRAFDGASVVASCAGPFLELGDAPVRAAIAAGAHYLDTSGEQAFARLVYERHGEAAVDRGVVLLTCFGFDYVPGDLAARIAAIGLEPVDEVIVAYSVHNVALSSGTRRTIGRAMGNSDAVAYENGIFVQSRFGATSRRVQFPFGERDVVEWGGTEPLTVPRHTSVRNVRSYVQAPKLVARVAPFARAAAPLMRLAGSIQGGPSPSSRAKARFAVVAEARRPPGGRRVTLVGSDVYGLTGLLIARAAQALVNGEVRAAGALAPAEAFDARELIADMDPFLRVESESDLF
ncbi:MAG: hypothetical protein QOE91_651 [Gaiellaceae bacterium]|nr:hypothetical protein [Gaiellaceae bacterium]